MERVASFPLVFAFLIINCGLPFECVNVLGQQGTALAYTASTEETDTELSCDRGESSIKKIKSKNLFTEIRKSKALAALAVK
ncbi:hypothetical protein FACHB389_31655 [Nostoc calcicola FACHB-389]|nr:hypothetical protein FACHB389_31655 [Nostoc calcicola FACHB-389]